MFVIQAFCPGEAEAQTAPQLAIAQGANWRTDLFDINTSSASVPVSMTECIYGDTILKPGEVRRTKDVGRLRCDGAEFWLIPAPIAPDVRSFTFLRFDDGKTRASFAVPPIGTLPANGWLRVAPVVNDADFVTHVDVFPAKPTHLVFEIYDGLNNKIADEFCDVAPPVGQCTIAKKFSSGSLVITNPGSGVGCVGCAPPPIAGFVTVSAPDGGNAYVLPFPY